MANTRDIRLRIKGVKSTRQITRAMQMVATSKMKKAQDAAKSGRPYAMLLADVIVTVADEFEEITHKYFNERPIRHRGILVIGTDKGLCGALNSISSECYLMLILLRNLSLWAKGQPNTYLVQEEIYWLILVYQINPDI